MCQCQTKIEKVILFNENSVCGLHIVNCVIAM